ncbi:unnamed protein product [Rotaria sordida]|uniref:aspartate transaminase n=1 Tax=Rotaria sordida TaxID=392033 RepID=A0A814PYH8_9BILA|nr:unnamed protein product [Rotaria sordida]CAF1112785.1 unnamed protein product [Rotaria sordida]
MPKFRTQMVAITRRNYSNPPAYGAYIIGTILNNPTLYNEWKTNIRTIYECIHSMRQLFYSKLKQLGTPSMFAYTGLNPGQYQTLIQQHHVYIMSNGSIHVCGIISKNIDEIAQKFYDVITNYVDDPKL